MATNITYEHQRHRKKENFLRQFRDEQSKEFKQLTASQFMEVWSHYDIDGSWLEEKPFCSRIVLTHLGNGFIEGRELDDLLRELASSVNAYDTSPEVRLVLLSFAVVRCCF